MVDTKHNIERLSVTVNRNTDGKVFIHNSAVSELKAMLIFYDNDDAQANAEEIARRSNMHDELIKTISLLSDFASKVIAYPKGEKGYDAVDSMNLEMQIEKAKQLLDQPNKK